MPGPSQAQSQELIPGYLTPLSCEFVSVSTGPAQRKRELQRPDDGRPSTSSKRSRRGQNRLLLKFINYLSLKIESCIFLGCNH